ncbi:MAG: hypothetical protein LBJ44_06845 [Propionibacteriaceae bacterium]|jgi:hypothetical protein|nr:hypothetical protein [Propionibacteriaceae bacterium]
MSERATAPEPAPPGRRPLLVRLDPAVHRALAQWSSDELRSLNAQIESILREALSRAGRLPAGLKPLRKPGRPPQQNQS